MKFLGTDLWTDLARLSKRRDSKKAAVAFYSDDSHVRFGAGDTIIVCASEETIATGQTSPDVLIRAHRRGARVFHHAKLHAKLLIAGDRAVVSSAWWFRKFCCVPFQKFCCS